ncbi:MAG: hypothetical protein WBA74_23300 [Cyclobacteriaceae bacterium]
MELLELKSVWDVVVKDTIARDHVDDFVVAKVIKKDSKALLSKIKRVMYAKFVLGGVTLVAGIVMVIGLFAEPDKFTFLEKIFSLTENKVFLSSVVLFVAGMLSGNYFAFREIARFNYGVNLHTSLQRFIKIMEQTIKLNVYSGSIFNSVALTWIFYAFTYRNEPFQWNISGFGSVMIVSVLAFIVMYIISRYEQRLKFGNHLDQLKSQLKEMEEND